MAGFKKFNRNFERDSERPSGNFGRRDNERPRGSFRERDFDRPRENFVRREKSEFEMFDVICDRCKKECKVPFKPTRGKPVYCSECFSKNSGSRGSSGGSSEGLEEINRKLDRIMQALKID